MTRPQTPSATPGFGAQGFRVLRFNNSQINAPDQVLGAILLAVEAPAVEI